MTEELTGANPPTSPSGPSSRFTWHDAFRWASEHWALVAVAAVFVGWLFGTAYAAGLGVPASALDTRLTDQLALSAAALASTVAAIVVVAWMEAARRYAWYSRTAGLVPMALLAAASTSYSLGVLVLSFGLYLLLFLLADYSAPRLLRLWRQRRLRRLQVGLQHAQAEFGELQREAERLDGILLADGVDLPPTPKHAVQPGEEAKMGSGKGQSRKISHPAGLPEIAVAWVALLVGLSVFGAYGAGHSVAHRRPLPYIWRLVVHPATGKLPTGECVTQVSPRVYLQGDEPTAVIYSHQPTEFTIDDCLVSKP